MEAQEWCHRYKVSGNVRDLNQAWDLYYHVFRRISRQLPQLTSLELQYVSPKLLMCRDLELAVPGSYIPGQPVVRIAQIQSSLQVITSKQRPRKLCIKGKVNQLIHSLCGKMLLENLIAVQLVKKLSTCMEFERSLLCSQKPTIGLGSIPVMSDPHLHFL
jgi:hypothetical protein